MLTPDQFHQLVSGERRGARAWACRAGFRAIASVYTACVRYRNRRFDRGQAQIHRLTVPVISVGNLSLGGTGKTPMIAWLARELQQRQWNTGIVSRGYGSRDGHPNDEARELAELLPKVPHVQDRDRVAAARRLLERHPGRLVLLDDGFQHRRLHRDIDIVLIDALQPDGFGHVFPRGTLREPMDGLRRADVAILTRSNRVPEARRREIQNMILQTAPEILWAESEHRPIRLVNGTGQSEPLSALHGKRVSAFCAIGNPDAFFQSIDTLLKDTPSQLVTRHAFPDHHHYDEQDIAMLAQQIRSSQSDVVVCTGKDLVKMRSTRTLGQRPLYALAIEFSFHSGEAELMQLIDQRLHCITGP